MLMIEKNLTAAIADEKIKQLYETAFPEDEQIPWKDLMRLVEEMPLDFTAYYDGEDFIGFTIVYPRKSINWFWYFAVCQELRGKGYGQKILTQMITIRDNPLSWTWKALRRSVRTLTNANAVKTSIFATALGTRMSIVPTTTSL
jgi:GNAT superfamily N-acetyltransferase